MRAAYHGLSLCCGPAVLPMYVTQDYIRVQTENDGNVAATSTFARLTMGNVPRGSSLLWCGEPRWPPILFPSFR